MGISRPLCPVFSGFSSVGLRATCRTVPGERSRISRDVRPGPFRELL